MYNIFFFHNYLFQILFFLQFKRFDAQKLSLYNKVQYINNFLFNYNNDKGYEEVSFIQNPIKTVCLPFP